jgi:membrane protein insertase Oxa1/YidC/SpoIIIJ
MISETVLACTTCAKAFHAAGGNAAGLAILFLLVVILALLSGVVFLFVRMARKQQALLPAEYRDDLSTPSQSL